MTKLDQRPAPAVRVEPRRSQPPVGRSGRVLGYSLLALLAYIPALLTAPGKVAADTKQYLYLDPDRLLERAPSMWDPNIGMGTVTHQNIGYLFPMGPYYWVMEHLGVPDWIAQRLWLGSILFAAGVGMLYLARTLSLRGAGAVVAALVYMLSPYSLHYASRISVILLAWAGLPWMIALVARALREGGWRYPAAFALVVQVVGSVNATALVFVGVAPALWVLYAVVIERVDWRRALAVVARVGLLTTLASLWWIAGLYAQGAYGLNILDYTETVETAANAGLAPEILRGLGYWFFYGRDKVGAWVDASVDYTQSNPRILIGYGLAGLAVLSAVVVRWRYRAYFVILTLAGTALAVGTHPYDDPSPLGAFFKSATDSSTAALALRSTGRAVPLVVLGLAALLGAGANAACRWFEGRDQRRLAFAAVGTVGLLAVLNLPALWNDRLYGESLRRPEDVPAYWLDAAAVLDARPHDTRVLEIPGSDFASYRWGNTVDPITPGLIDRPWLARELVPWGSPAGQDLLNAFDRRLQEGVLDPAAIAPVARLLGVGDIVLRSDLQVDRYNLARPDATWAVLNPPPPGLDEPETFGTDLGGDLKFPLIDELSLALPPGAPEPPPVAIFGVEDALPIVRSAPATGPLVVAGDGEGLVSAASVGLLDRPGVIFYSASYASDPGALRDELGRGAVLVVTDSNRKAGQRWSSVRDNRGATERVDETALDADPGDSRLEVFPDADVDAYSVVEQHGAEVSATGYGNPISYEPEDRAARAFDGDLRTGWKVGGSAEAVGHRIRVDLDNPITADHVDLVQPLFGPNERYITRATLTFDDEEKVAVELGPASRTPDGERVEFPKRTFSRLEIRVDADSGGTSWVGFAEIGLRDDAPDAAPVRVSETVRMPTDLLEVAGPASVDNRLVLLMTRSRTILVGPRLAEDEEWLARGFDLPTGRDFDVGGTARVSTVAPDATIDAVLGLPGPGQGAVTAASSARMPGDPGARGRSAVDGDPATAWTTPFDAPVDQWVEVEAPAPVTLDRLDLAVVADGRHSVPTRLRVETETGARVVEVPAVEDEAATGATVDVPVTFEPLAGQRVRVTIDAVRSVESREYYTGEDVVLPAGIAELGIPGVQAPALPAELPGTCRSDLLEVDGTPVPVRITGSTATAEARRGLTVERCDEAVEGGAPGPLRLGSGRHDLVTAPGLRTGLDLDELVLGSEAGGGVLRLGERGAVPAEADITGGRPGAAAGAPTRSPAVTVDEQGRTEMKLHVRDAEEPFWLVLGESENAGWRATVDGHDLGRPTLVNGYANGWLVPAGDGNLAITLAWEPQRTVRVAIAISGLTMVVCTALALWRRRGRGLGERDEPGAPRAASAPGDEDPVLIPPFVAGGRQPGRAGLVLAPLGAAVVAGALVRPWVGLLVGGLVLIVLLRPRLRWVLTISAPAAVALAAAYIVVQNVRYDYPAIFEWPTYFERVHVVGWLAVVLLAADVLVEIVRQPQSSR